MSTLPVISNRQNLVRINRVDKIRLVLFSPNYIMLVVKCFLFKNKLTLQACEVSEEAICISCAQRRLDRGGPFYLIRFN